jgi:hypothetical protein
MDFRFAEHLSAWTIFSSSMRTLFSSVFGVSVDQDRAPRGRLSARDFATLFCCVVLEIVAGIMLGTARRTLRCERAELLRNCRQLSGPLASSSIICPLYRAQRMRAAIHLALLTSGLLRKVPQCFIQFNTFFVNAASSGAKGCLWLSSIHRMGLVIERDDTDHHGHPDSV